MLEHIEKGLRKYIYIGYNEDIEMVDKFGGGIIETFCRIEQNH